MTREFSVLVKFNTIYFFLENCHKFELLISQGTAATYGRNGGKYYTGFVGKLFLFPVSSSERILKIRYELTKLSPCVWCTGFWGHSV